jgi:predicted transcriptional regulator
MIPLLGTIKVLDTGIDHWGRHNLYFIPPHLMKRLQELGECSVVVPSLQEMHEFNREVHNRSLESGSFFELSSSFKSDFRMLFSDLAQRGVRMSFIVSPELMDHLNIERYEEFKQYLETGGVEFYLYPQKMPFISFVRNDFCLLFEMLTKEGTYDNTQLVCCDPFALKWGKELFEYYSQNSTLISGI